MRAWPRIAWACLGCLLSQAESRSATTLSTTGFGDALPVTSSARAAVILEQLAGVLYVALVISRLAGFASQKQE